MSQAARQPEPLYEHPREQILELLESGNLELPILPDTASRILVACRDDDTGSRKVADLMERDPALAAHVLRLANSAAYSPGQPIVSLTQAVSQLGFGTVGEITMSVALHSRVFAATRFTLQLRSIWAHAAVAGGWARQIARLRRANVEGAFLCGLLHDMGRPIILHALTKIERQLGQTFDDDEVLVTCDELHPSVGAALVRHWSLAEWMADAIAWHHDYQAAPAHRDEVMCTTLSEHLAGWALEERPTLEELTASPLVAALHIYPEDLESLIEARDGVVSLAKIFS